jgi:hypothetical protein
MADDLAEKLRYWRERGAAFGHDRGHTSKTTPVLNEFTGRVGGTQTEHRDGRVDAHVTPETYRIKTGAADG